MITTLALVALGGSLAVEPADPDRLYPRVLAGEREISLALPLTEPLLTDLRTRSWDAAAQGLLDMDSEALPDEQRDEWAFLTAWCLVHADRAEEADELVDLATASDVPPRAWVDLVVGEVHLAAGRHVQALLALEAVPEEARVWPRAQAQRAEVLRKLSRESEAWPVLEALAQRDDPQAGVPQALQALAWHAGSGSPQACEHARRLWWAYPRTDESAAVAPLLDECPPPTWEQAGRRAENLMYMGDWNGAIALTQGHLSQVKGDSLDACRFLYARGRAQYKKNQLTNAAATLDGIARRCAEVDGPYGYKGSYLRGTALFRKRAHAAAAREFALLPELYPESTYADDGYTQQGIALQEAGDLDGARKAWQKGLESYPEGDTVPEATWRMAFAYYLEGHTPEAIAVAESLAALPLTGDPVHVRAGQYWAARWRYYPDVHDPSAPNPDAAARQEAIERWVALCREHPHSYYALLSWSRLKEVAPDQAQALSQRPEGHERAVEPHPWSVRLAFWKDPAVQRGLALARLGLIQEARVEWRDLDTEALQAEEMALLMDARIRAGDWLYAHDAMRDWLVHNPPVTLGPHRAQVLRLAYPDRYWAEVQAAASPYKRYEPRLFHGLVREESNFNRNIRSHAGAIGLSQLMPATAKQTAGWLGLTYSRARLTEPDYNLPIGARYLEAMHKQLGDSHYLALAAYNAGAGRQKQWLGQWGNVPTDEYVERIPFRETRHYVKRVTTSWQTYHFQFDEGPAFPDLSAYNHHALPE